MPDCNNCNLKKKKITGCPEAGGDNCAYSVTRLLPGSLKMGAAYFLSGFIFSVPAFYNIYASLGNFYLLLFTTAFLLPVGIWGLIVSWSGIYMSFTAFARPIVVTHKSSGKRYKIFTLKK